MFTMIVLSVYVVNRMVYIFGSKYISVKRIIIEIVIELIYSISLILNTNYKFVETDDRWLWYINVLFIISIILEGIYYIICSYVYDEKKTKQRHVISNKVFQVLCAIIIMMAIFCSFLNSFNYFSCIEALQCVMPALYILFEPYVSVVEE